MDDEQRERFEQAVDRKREDAERRSREGAQHAGGSAVSGGTERPLVEHGRPQDVADPRAKNSGHGKKTADKWNQ